MIGGKGWGALFGADAKMKSFSPDALALTRQDARPEKSTILELGFAAI